MTPTGWIWLLPALLLPAVGRILSARYLPVGAAGVRFLRILWMVLVLGAWGQLALTAGAHGGKSWDPGAIFFVLLAGAITVELIVLVPGRVPGERAGRFFRKHGGRGEALKGTGGRSGASGGAPRGHGGGVSGGGASGADAFGAAGFGRTGAAGFEGAALAARSGRPEPGLLQGAGAAEARGGAGSLGDAAGAAQRAGEGEETEGGESAGDLALPPSAQALLHRILLLDRIPCEEIMTPRLSVVAVDASRSAAEVLQVMVERRSSHAVVIAGSFDRVVGVAHAKDLVPLVLESGGNTPAGRHLRRALRVLRERPVAPLLEDFRRDRVQVGIVSDARGALLGLVTIGDVFRFLAGSAPAAGTRDREERRPEDGTS